MAAKTLMIQGTASSVGKSLLVAGLCRVFRQDGVRVAPFKSQNMALNSFVTAGGGEMGRAQVVQAMAAGLDPRVEMNPILLKPEADHRSQVVVMGRPQGSMGFRDYRALRSELLGIVEGALYHLRAEHDLVIIEGAGSPAEINLKAGEIVNMRIARMAQAPVILTGDIDRGGVFAHLVGTLALLDDEERSFVKGFFINKFRGDVSLLQPGLDFLEQRTGTPVLGVIPYVPELRLPEEDSVSLETLPLRPGGEGDRGETGRLPIIDIAVVKLPHVSNFDDFDPLAAEPGVGVRYVSSTEELGRPDLVILPGTKTTIADLRWMERRGLAASVHALVQAGVPAIGICGGYQMLGSSIEDPLGVEAAVGEVVAGLGLLPIRTIFEPSKSTHQVRAIVAAGSGILAGCDGLSAAGYEIHMGRSQLTGGVATPAFTIASRSGSSPVAGTEQDGLLSTEGRVLGTYLHGLFDNAGVRRALLKNLAAAKGLAHAPEAQSWGQLATLDDQLDRLAAVLRDSVDLPRLYDIAGL
ncbi:MAG: Cobyric acid synthase [uncultured Chloroflexi bacterium]|uniref:Cobyric acid synthase n=1 Tax=uncultured Chloroflexota bacterium TaxID=166587 RepID=A0A6J4JQU9_9CHLR|nr:MAG: Cobyric acid synthase [uncultured Chloroflexota bacterium]